MKLHEIRGVMLVEDDLDFLRDGMPKRTQQIMDTKRKMPGHARVGTGSQAYVGTYDNDNFGDVERISTTSGGGSKFLTAIYNTPGMQSNPFLPKVRSVETQGKTHIAVAERLLPFNTPGILSSEPLMQMLWERYFNAKAPSDFKAGIESQVDRILSNHTVRGIKDTDLAVACMFIYKLVQKWGGECDPGSTNLMWRPGLHYPQLVLNDPIV